MKFIKKLKSKKLLLLCTLSLLILLGIGFINFNYFDNIDKNEICLDCEKWEKYHENRQFCTMMIWNCLVCGEERHCA